MISTDFQLDSKGDIIMKSIFTTLALAITLIGCATPILSEKGRLVKVLQGEPPTTCKFVARVDGVFGGGWTAAGDLEGALNEIYNETAKQGGTAVRIVSQQSSSLNTSIIGEAYDCSKRSGM
jgi:hypothetical protein